MTHPPTSEFFSDLWIFFNLPKPLSAPAYALVCFALYQDKNAKFDKESLVLSKPDEIYQVKYLKSSIPEILYLLCITYSMSENINFMIANI